MAFSESVNPSTRQPGAVFFEFRLGNLQMIYKASPMHGDSGPQLPVEATIEQTTGGFEGKVTISLFDDAGREVEQAILSHLTAEGHMQTPVAFRWGYLTGPGGESDIDFTSDIYETLITDVETQIGRNFFTFTLHGTFTAVRAFFNSSKLKDGTIDEIFTEYARLYGYRLDISPPFSRRRMTAPDSDGSTTLERPQIFRKQGNENDYMFVSRVLNYAIAEDGKGGYIMQHSSEKGRNVLHIRRPDAVGHYRSYHVQHKQSDVLEWQPQLQIALAGPLQGASLASAGTRYITGDISNVNTNQKNAGAVVPHPNRPTFTTTVSPEGGDTEKLEQFVTTDDAVRNGRVVSAVAAPTRDPNTARNYHINTFLKQHLKVHEATLTVMGDPHCQPLRTVDIKYTYPSSLDPAYGVSTQQHYSSGRWLVVSVTHSISLGSYQTVLVLHRFGSERAPGAS